MSLKKTLSVILMTTFLLGACGKSDTSKEEKTTENIAGEITVLTNRTDGDAIFKTIEDKFIEENPDVTAVHFENIADYDSTVTTRLNSGDYGDVLFIPFSMAGNRAEYPNYFESLGTIPELQDKYLDVREADFDDQVYGLPVALNSLGFIYNEKVLRDAGITDIPKTTAEFVNNLKTIKEKTDATPFYTNYQAVAVWAGALTSFGGEQYKTKTLEAGDAFAKGQPIREVMDLFYTMSSNGLIEPDPVTMDSQKAFQDLADGKVAMLMNGSQEVAGIQKLTKDPIAIMNFPVETDGRTSLPLGAPAVIGINKHSKNKETAKAFVEFFDSSASGYAKDLNGMPNKISDLSPEQKEVVDNSHVILTVATETPEVNDAYAKIADEVGVSRLTDVLQKTINIGLYPDKNESYDDYIAQLSKKWQEAEQHND